MAHSMMLFLFLFTMLYAIVDADVQYGMLDFSPRFMFGSVVKRQAEGIACDIEGYHSCLEANSTNACCSNDEYCYLGPGGAVDCCAIGSDCDNQCPVSSDIAIPQTITVSGNSTTTFSCSSRACPAASAFLCPTSLGGACCSYGSTCGTNGGCTSTVNSNTVIPQASTATGCLTGQFSCPTAEGGGCCNSGAQCTASDSTLLCVVTATTGSGTITPTAIRTGPSGIIDSNFTEINTSSGLSSGAKAGIGVGAALGIVIVIVGIILFAISRRRAQHAQAFGGTVAKSEGSNEEKRFSPRSKAGTDYFGPTAKAGPFTEGVAASGLSPIGSPDSRNRGVPLSPQGPGDIAAPVEIADSARVVPPNPYVSETPEKPEFRIELP